MASSPQQLQLFLRLPAVLQKVGMSKSFVYDLITQDKFPKPVKVSSRISCWVTAEVEQWVQEQLDGRE